MNKKNVLRKRKGFTLVELIVVIAILGILAVIVIPRLGTFTTSAERRSVQADHRILVATAQMFYAEDAEWPSTEDELLPYLEGGWPEENNGEHTIGETGIISKHGGGGEAGTNEWTYTFSDDGSEDDD